MSHFKILILHYLRCLLTITVTARRALTRLSDGTPLLHVMYECMRWTYFSLPRRDPQRRLLKKNVNYPRETTGPCQALAEGRGNSAGGERRQKRAAEGGGTETGGMPGEGVGLLLIPHRRRLCLRPVNWNTKQRGVDGSIGDEDGEGQPLSVSGNAQPSLLAGN